MRRAIAGGRLPNRTNAFLRWCSRLFLVAGSVALVWSGYLWTDAHVYQTVQEQLFHAIRENGSVNPGPVSEGNTVTAHHSSAEIGSVMGEIEVPRIGLSVMVLEGDDAGILSRAAGHLQNTAMPGEPGNVAIAAHRDTFFWALRNIREQDIIELATLTGSYRYRVESVEVVTPDDTAVLDASPQPTLTLITCYPFYYVGPAPKRFIVRALQISPGSPSEVVRLQQPDPTNPPQVK